MTLRARRDALVATLTETIQRQRQARQAMEQAQIEAVQVQAQIALVDALLAEEADAQSHADHS